jgi:hypothetical protein
MDNYLQHSTRNGTESNETEMTPRQQWLHKEKALKIKFFIILILSHTMWPIYLTSSNEVQMVIKAPLKLEKDYELLKVPAQIFTTSPRPHSKIKVSIVLNQYTMIKKAYLRAIENDPLSPTGVKATLEIPKKYMNIVKKSGGKIWHVYPPIPSMKSLKGSPYEVSI